jgi:hypothetical protein
MSSIVLALAHHCLTSERRKSVKRKATKKKMKSGKPSKELFEGWELPVTLFGWWGFQLTGTTPMKTPWPPLRPPPLYLRHVAFVGRIYFNGVNSVRSYFSVNHNGTVDEFTFTQGDTTNRVAGMYQVNSDNATGSINYPPSVSFPLGAKLNFVVTKGGNELFLISMLPAVPVEVPLRGQLPPEPLPGVCLYGIAKRG